MLSLLRVFWVWLGRKTLQDFCLSRLCNCLNSRIMVRIMVRIHLPSNPPFAHETRSWEPWNCFYITSTRAIYIWALKAIRDCTGKTMSPQAMKCKLTTHCNSLICISSLTPGSLSFLYIIPVGPLFFLWSSRSFYRIGLFYWNALLKGN